MAPDYTGKGGSVSYATMRRAGEVLARLEQLRQERGDLHERQRELAEREGQALLAAHRHPHVSMTEACATLEVSRPGGYRLMYAAEGRPR